MIAIGLFLIAAAILKLVGPNTGRANSALPLAMAWFGAEIELVVGGWLVSGRNRVQALLVALVLFSILGFISLRLWIIGAPSCGCAGQVMVRPIWAMLFDIAVVTVLTCRLLRRDDAGSIRRPRLNLFSKRVVVCLMFVGAFAGTLMYRNDEVLIRGTSRLRGEELFVDPRNTDLGVLQRGTHSEVTLTIENASTHAVSLVGAKADCHCVVVNGLPAILAANGKTKLVCDVSTTGKLGRFTRRIEIYTTSSKQGPLQFNVSGKCVDSVGSTDNAMTSNVYEFDSTKQN